MLHVIFVPGLFGCSMIGSDGVQLWPPVAQPEPMDPFTRAAGLRDEGTRVGGIVEQINDPFLFQPVYGPILDTLKSLPGVNVIPFAYDWRRDVIGESEKLGAVVQDCVQGKDDQVVIVAHSLGGLVARAFLEAPTFQKAPWFKAVQRFIAIATPHLGAPLALFRILGFEPLFSGIAAFVFPASAVAQLAARPDVFPAAYQLLPARSQPCVTLPSAKVTDVFSGFPGLDPVGVRAADVLYNLLGRFRTPRNVAYQLAYGIGHLDGNGRLDTADGIVLDAHGTPLHESGNGDGTVPVWSSRPVGAKFSQDAVAFRAEHLDLVKDAGLLAQLKVWVGPPVLVASREQLAA